MKTLVLRPGAGNAVISTPRNRIKNRRWWIIPLLLTTVPAGYFLLQNSQVGAQVSNASQSEASLTDLIAAEKLNPEEYITGQVKMRRNFINEIIVEGSLRNIARYTGYKDPVLHVDFLSKTGTILFTEDYKIKGTLHPNDHTDYKFRNPPLDGVERIAGKILIVELEK